MTGYELARQILVDPRFSVRGTHSPAGDAQTQASAELQDAFTGRPEMAGVLITLDPPQHTRIRRALAGYFSVRSIEDHRTAIERIVNDQLDAMQTAQEPVDLVEKFAIPVASLTICHLLGAPFSDREHFERPTKIIDNVNASGAEKIQALEEFFAYCRTLIRNVDSSSCDGLLGALVAKGELTENEMVGVTLQLLMAGHETTASTIPLSMFALLCNRPLWDHLVDDRSKISSIVEELLRYLTILQLGATRTALEDLTIHNRVIRDGDSVTVSLSAANRDPGKFFNPNDLEITNHASGHLAFGHGRHICIGQHLARLELAIALEGLASRFPRLDLAVLSSDVSFHVGEAPVYGVEELPLFLEPR